MWGLFPLYFAYLKEISPFEVVAHRIIWSSVFLAVLVTIIRRWAAVRSTLSGRNFAYLAAAAAILATNWCLYVYAVTTDRVVEASLGYFINPLVTVLLAVVVLRERLTNGQWRAVALAFVGVAIITIWSGAPPWVGLTLAFSFGIYGLIRKHVNVGALEGLTIETGTLVLVAVGFLFVTNAPVHGPAEDGTWSIAVLLMLSGPITALPLLAFGAAARRLPLATLGLLQYLTPTIVFILGVAVFHESISAGEWVGFVFIWLALVVLTWSGLRKSSAVDVESTDAEVAASDSH